MSIANELITRGWCQNALEDADGAVCLFGAMRAMVGGSPAEMGSAHHGEPRYMAAYRALLESIPDSQAISVWNNAPERTFDEVLRVAKMADELLDAERDAR